MRHWRPAPDRRALGREALAYADTLHNLARYLARSESEAEDLVQETYVRALQAFAQFTPGTNLKAWLFSILRNAHLSRRRSERTAPVEGDAEELVAAADARLDAPAPGDDFGLAQTTRLVGKDIEEAMRELTEDARTVIWLDLEGLTEAEMALALGCAAGTVKSRLARARAALRQRLADYARCERRA